jgi:transcriptional regulator with XRE-family HTH domain
VKLEAVALGDAIREARKAKGLSQVRAAARGGYTQVEWSRFERGVSDLRVTTLIGVALAIRVSPGSILNRAVRSLRTGSARPSGAVRRAPSH